MIIECPACSKKFNIDEKLIPDEGRLLKCGNCDHTWFFKKEENIKLEAETQKITEIEENESENNIEKLIPNKNKISKNKYHIVHKWKRDSLNYIFEIIFSTKLFISIAEPFFN